MSRNATLTKSASKKSSTARKPLETTATEPLLKPGQLAHVTVVDAKPDVKDVEIERNKDNPIDLGEALEIAGMFRTAGEFQNWFDAEVKTKLLTEKATNGTSESYTARLQGGGQTYSVDVDKFLKLCKKRGIPQAKVNAVLSVTRDKVEFLSKDDLATCLNPCGVREASLYVDPKKDLLNPVKPVDALRKLASFLEKGVINDKTTKSKKK